MGKRLVGGAAALGLAVGLVATAVVAASGAGDEGSPEPLPVLGAGAAAGDTATAEAGEGGDAARMSIGPVEYEVAGDLPALDGQARAWALEAPDDLDARIHELAERLGLPGEVRREAGTEESPAAWRLSDGSRFFEVYPYAGLPWNLYDTAGEAGVECAPDGECAEPVRPADLPSRDEAEAIARDLLGSAVDGSDVSVSDGTTSWYVQFDPVVGGLPTLGMASSVSVGGGGEVQFASGWLGDAEEGDEYPLVGTEEALRRLRDESPIALDAPAIACEPGPAVDCAPAEPITVTITGVRLGLQLIGEWLVPSYLFAVEDGGPGGELPTIAVDDEFLVEPEPVAVEPDTPVSSGPGAPPQVDPAKPTEPTGPTEPSACAEAVGSGEQPLVLSVCAGPAVAGEPTVFTITASDPDAPVRDDCGSPRVSFGDESGATAVCEIACVPPTEPTGGSVERIEEHTYAEAGEYTVEVTAESNCGAAPGERLTVTLPVTVTD